MTDQETERGVKPAQGASHPPGHPPGAAAPSDVAGYGRVADSTSRLERRGSAPPDLTRPLETFESSPIGEYLRRQRVLRDVSMSELSELTRIPLRSLERLERGEFDGVSDGFVRGFVRTVAEALGLNVEDTVARILQEPALGAWDRHNSNRRLKQAFVGASLLVLLGLAFLILQAGWRVLVGGSENDPARQVLLWRDPVRSLADATGVEVDPAGEIDPSAPIFPIIPTPGAAASGPAALAKTTANTRATVTGTPRNAQGSNLPGTSASGQPGGATGRTRGSAPTTTSNSIRTPANTPANPAAEPAPAAIGSGATDAGDRL